MSNDAVYWGIMGGSETNCRQMLTSEQENHSHKEEHLLKLLRKKLASIAIIVSMLVSLLPAMSVSAASTLTITNLYTPPAGTTDDAMSTDPNASLVNRFTVNPITLDVLMNGIADDQVTNIYYEIYNLNTKQNSIVKTNKAIKSASNSSQISFQNVQLTTGLNKVTIKFGASGGIASSPSYAYYTPVTNITNLKFNGEDFVDGGIYPKNGSYIGNITGTASNANEVEGNYKGTVYQPASFVNGNFTFVTNTGRTSDIALNPGDNKIIFATSNLTNYYTANRSFVYDNGKSFAYNAQIGLAGTPSMSKLADEPVITDAPSVQKVNVSANLKMPASSTATVAKYVRIYTGGKASEYVQIDPSGITNGWTYTGTSGGTLSSGSVTGATYNSTGGYYDLQFNGILPVDINRTKQQVYFDFLDANLLVISNSQYTFTYSDPNQPYVDSVSVVRTPIGGGATYEAPISESGTTQISEFPSKLKFYTNDKADKVEIKINNNTYDAAGKLYDVAAVAGDAAKRNSVTVDLQGIPDGPVTMEVIPYKANAAYSAGIKKYSLVISSAPYVIINNLYNGVVLNDKVQLTCPAISGSGAPCISGRIVNLSTQADYAKVEYTLNDVPLTLSKKPGFDTDNVTPNIKNGTFVIDKTSLSNSISKDGKYTLKVKLFVNGQPVTTASLDIFILSDNVPIINYLRPQENEPLNPQFIATSQPDTYVTRAEGLTLQAETVNSPIDNTSQGSALYLRKAPSDYTSIATGSIITFNSAGSSSPQVAATNVLPLNVYGDYVFELVSNNTVSGTTATKLVTITREPVPYAFVMPAPSQIIKNSKGLDQASINQNFYMIKLRADKADSITVGKDQAIYDKANNQYVYEVKNLKAGANEIKFTVNRGTTKTNASIVLFFTNTGIEGAQYKSPLSATMKIFDGDIQLKFPKDTKLMRYDRDDQYITTDRQILFGIANNDDGRVDKVNEVGSGLSILTTPGHFRTASKKFWIDAGYIATNEKANSGFLQNAYLGSGILPFDSQKPLLARIYKDLVVPTKRGTLTLKYDSTIRDDSWKYLAVYQFGYFDDPDGEGIPTPSWKNIGGKVDTKTNTIEVPFDSFGYYQVMYMNDSFSDVTNHPWARDDMDTLFSKGIMEAKAEPQFMPNDSIKRGEFVTMLVKIFDIPLINQDTEQNPISTNGITGTFNDVQIGYSDPTGLSDFMHIEAAARAGIVRGSSNGLFLPGDDITRQDAAVMIARAAELKLNTDETKSLATLTKLFTDGKNIDIYALPSVEAVAKAGLIEGKDNVLLQGQKKISQRFDPTENFTRAEASAVAIRVLKQQKKIPK
jgi:hypothetical protein